MGFIRECVRYTFMAYFNLFYKIDEMGKENIPKNGAYVLCSNHIHWMDPILYVCENRRMIYAIGKDSLFNSPIKNFVMRRLGVMPVSRESAGANLSSIEEGINRLQEGNLLLIYPEGTRNPYMEDIKPKKGVALFALEAKVPIIPMAMVGSFKPGTKIRFKIGKPIDISEYYPNEDEKVNPRNLVKVTNNVMDEILKLRDEIITDEIKEQMKLAEDKRVIRRQKKIKAKEKVKEITDSKE